MIKELAVKNYKAFDKAQIPINQLTIFLGANSVGKSSIIQLLLLLQQTSKEDFKSYKSALKLYGGSVNLGDAKNLFRKQDIGKSLEFTLGVKDQEFKDFFKEALEEYKYTFRRMAMYIPLKGLIDLRSSDSINTRKDFEKYVDTFIKVLSKGHNIREYANEIKWFLKSRTYIQLSELDTLDKEGLMKVYDFLEGGSNTAKNEVFDFTFKIKYHRGNLFTQSFVIKSNDKIIVGFEKGEGYVFFSDYVRLTEEENEELTKAINVNSTIFNLFVKSYEFRSTVTSFFHRILVRLLEVAKSQFSEEKINYVSPLRAHPKRYYMLDKAKINYTLDTLDGDAIADVLKEDAPLSKKVNDWLKNFNLAVSVEEFKEVVHHLKVKQNNLNLDITDVGFGISQVLPVIIQGFLSKNNSTTIIEQPEIHLHPKMQADLADLFIDIILNSKEKRLIIETHSEYLLKRLRRRISEGKITADKVSICLFNPQTLEASGHIDVLEIGEKGFFEWPIDFYGGDLYDDTVEFIKNQN